METKKLFDARGSMFIDNLDLKRDAREQVGDGKEPNRFFVTLCNEGQFECGDDDLDFGSNGNTIAITTKVYETLEEAMAYVNDISLVEDEKEESSVRYVMVEDRLTGTVFERFVQKKMVPNYTVIEF